MVAFALCMLITGSINTIATKYQVRSSSSTSTTTATATTTTTAATRTAPLEWNAALPL